MVSRLAAVVRSARQNVRSSASGDAPNKLPPITADTRMAVPVIDRMLKLYIARSISGLATTGGKRCTS